MRTTLSLYDTVYDQVIEYSRRNGLSLKESFNKLIMEGLAAERAESAGSKFTMKTHSMGADTGDYDLDRALSLAGELEAAETAHNLDLRK